MDVSKEKLRRDLLERYISTGKVGLIKPASDADAIDLIETVVDLYNSNKPTTRTLSEMSNQMKKMLDF